MRRTALLAASLSAALVAACPSAQAAFPGRNGEIAFARLTDGRLPHSVLAFARLDGRRVPMVRACRSTRPCDSTDPAWSPDGRRLAQVRADLSRNIFIGTRRGRRISSFRGPSGSFIQLEQPAWSPDGRRLVLTGVTRRDYGAEPGMNRTEERSAIYVVGSDGRGLRRVSTGPFDSAPVWSARGRIAFTRAQSFGGAEDLYTVRPDGKALRRVTVTGGRDADWSPDGRRIAFSRGADGEESVFTVREDGGGLRRLTRTGDSRQPAFSPDGRYVTYVHRESIWVMRRDGTHKRRLAVPHGADSFSAPDWRPLPRGR